MRPAVFEISVAHVVDAEDVDVGVFGDAFLDVGVKFDGELFAFLGGFGSVHHFGTLGFGHCCERLSTVVSVLLVFLVRSQKNIFDS